MNRLANKEVKINELVIHVSENCNLNCKHCSYSYRPPDKDNISIDKWKSIIDEAIEVGVTNFIVIGGEPLLYIDRTEQILNHLQQRKVPYGMVTNGTLIKNNIKRLKKHKLSFLDVSIDGLEEEHDRTRGKGNFKKSVEGIKLVLENNIAERTFLASTVMSHNYKKMPDMIKHFQNLGVKYFVLGLYVYVGTNPKEWILQQEQLRELIESIKNINAEQMIIDIHTHIQQYWHDLIKDGIIDKNNIRIDSNNNVYYKIPGTKVFLKNSMYTTNFWNTAIITADGYYIDDYEYIGTPNYKEMAIGNTKNMSMKELVEKVKKVGPERFIRKMKKYS